MKDSYVKKLFTAWEEAEVNMHKIFMNDPNPTRAYSRSHSQPVMQSAEEIKDAVEYEQVFRQYLGVCNRAIKYNKNKFPFNESWNSRVRALEEEATLHAIVYDDRPKVAFTLRLNRDMELKIVGKQPIPSEDEWPFTYQYLKRVVSNPQEYIENPEKLEWGWLRTIFGTA